MEKILIVEDEKEIREIEADYLSKEGYSIIEAENGDQAIQLFTKENPDLILLDLNLPLLDGVEVCKIIREKSGVPIIMVTARTKEIDELLGLEIGADDYIKKPFSPKVLVSRVKALLKRPQIMDLETITKGSIKMNLEARTIYVNNELREITSVQFNILQQLISNPGKVFSRYDLIDKSYNKDDSPDIFDRTMDSHIKNIRKIIEENPKKPKYILTIRGIGYKFNETI